MDLSRSRRLGSRIRLAASRRNWIGNSLTRPGVNYVAHGGVRVFRVAYPSLGLEWIGHTPSSSVHYGVFCGATPRVMFL